MVQYPAGALRMPLAGMAVHRPAGRLSDRLRADSTVEPSRCAKQRQDRVRAWLRWGGAGRGGAAHVAAVDPAAAGLDAALHQPERHRVQAQPAAGRGDAADLRHHAVHGRLRGGEGQPPAANPQAGRLRASRALARAACRDAAPGVVRAWDAPAGQCANALTTAYSSLASYTTRVLVQRARAIQPDPRVQHRRA